MQKRLIVVALVVGAAAAVGAQKPTYKRDMPPALVKQAKVKEADAVAMALKLVPGSEVGSAELENEGGKLIYSFDMKTAGKSGIDEVNIDAKTGKQVGKVSHEGPADEAKEAAAEKKAPKKAGGGGR